LGLKAPRGGVKRLFVQEDLTDPRSLELWFSEEVLPLGPLIEKLIARYWRDPAEIEDLRQDVFVRIFQTAHRMRPDPVRPYIILTARNLVIDKLRHKRSVSMEVVSDLEAFSVIDSRPTPEQHVIAQQELIRIQHALNALPTRCREIVVMRKIHGVSQREIAKRMGIKEQTVQTQIVRGMKAISRISAERQFAAA